MGIEKIGSQDVDQSMYEHIQCTCTHTACMHAVYVKKELEIEKEREREREREKERGEGGSPLV